MTERLSGEADDGRRRHAVYEARGRLRAFCARDVAPVNGIAVPVARDGEILAEGVYGVHLADDPTRHAEIMAIGRATRRLGTLVLSLYPRKISSRMVQTTVADQPVMH